ncbi:hypothetical protein M2145_002457 [Lachnospiraceae bacterium PF1-21]|uniref:ArnT family glycosyltransferase n=1 Tax=Ohessyouella blattaphilus TaxID=2949333 RepID=UPI003E268CEC
MSVKSWIDRIKTKRNLFIFVFFIGVFLLALPYLNQNSWSDESDNLVGGKVVAEGGVIYKDYFSQHTPLLYYIVAIFMKLGFKEVFSIRVCFYALITIFFAFIYVRYNKLFGKISLLALPVFFILEFARHNFMWTVLSDMVQAMACLMLFLEFSKYIMEKRARLTKISVLLISISIFVAIGVAFMSVYPIAIIAIGVFLNELYLFQQNKKDEILNKIGDIVIRFLPIIIVTLFFLVLYLAYYFYHDVLKEMIYQSFTFNMTVYSKYNQQASPIMTFIRTIKSYVDYVYESFSTLYNLSTIQNVILIIGNIGFSIFFFCKKKIYSIISFIFIIYCGIRGFQGFHSTPYILMSCFCVTFLLEHVFVKFLRRKDIRTRSLSACGALLVLILFFQPYATNIENISRLNDTKVYTTSPYAYYVDEFVKEDEYIYTTFLDGDIYFATDAKNATFLYSGLCPWVAEAFLPRVIDEIQKNKPKIILYDPKYKIWDYTYEEYCSELEEVLENDYINSKNIVMEKMNDNVWVRRDVPNITETTDEWFYSQNQLYNISLEETETNSKIHGITQEENRFIINEEGAFYSYNFENVLDSRKLRKNIYVRINFSANQEDRLTLYSTTAEPSGQRTENVLSQRYKSGEEVMYFVLPENTDLETLRFGFADTPGTVIEISSIEFAD